MSILIFVVVLIVLIVVHELGHFIVAKLSKMRVDEFGLGYPPRIVVVGKIGETLLTLNWLPFGGFVKIHGEDGLSMYEALDTKSFSSKNRLAQALVLVAGIAMNLVFAYVLITGALVVGTPRVLSEGETAVAKNVELSVASVLTDSPAAKAGILAGDTILSAEDGHYVFSGVDPTAFTEFVSNGRGNTTITLSIKRMDGSEVTIFARPMLGIIASEPERPVLGIEVATIGVVPLSIWQAITEGASLTWGTIVVVATGLINFFYGILTFSADMSQVSGPVGIASVVGGAYASGFGNLLSIMAIISINLALINLLPFPALDGGRLLFVIVESIIRRPIKPVVARTVNSIGFAMLILLMVAVTAHDLFKIFG